ncbi:hypothetical protein FRB98_009584 [Tulasnella sp. 332]|nr:hypothetical protein FRB98_009584 [Tulasnella sp. 332]
MSTRERNEPNHRSKLTKAAPPSATPSRFTRPSTEVQNGSTSTQTINLPNGRPRQNSDAIRPRTLKKKTSSSPSTPRVRTGSDVNWNYTTTVWGGQEERANSAAGPEPLNRYAMGSTSGSWTDHEQVAYDVTRDLEIAHRLQDEEYGALTTYNSMAGRGTTGSSTEDLAILKAIQLSLFGGSIDKPLPDIPSNGKGRASESDSPPPYSPPGLGYAPKLSTCGICGDEFRLVTDPVNQSITASGSSQDATPYGVSMDCPSAHRYCLSCMTSYVRTKLEAPIGAAFPIRCPECPRAVAWEMGDELATNVLGRDLLDVWHFQKLVASVSSFYCPNTTCSAPIALDVDDPNMTQAECPSCHISMCFQCRTPWHEV